MNEDGMIGAKLDRPGVSTHLRSYVERELAVEVCFISLTGD